MGRGGGRKREEEGCLGGGKRGRGREETVFLIFECGLHKQVSGNS
jgi:hypothetical protein